MKTLVVAVEAPPGGGKSALLSHVADAGGLPGAAVGLRVEVRAQDAAAAAQHLMDLGAWPARWALFTELYFLMERVRACGAPPASAMTQCPAPRG